MSRSAELPSEPWRKSYEFSDVTGAKTAINELLEQLENHGWPEDNRGIAGIHLATEEAVVNAIKHGNNKDENKNVQVECTVSDRQFSIRITDEGSGFNPDDIPDPTAPENLEVPSGRGVMLMRNFMDIVEFNQKGNSVYMQRNFPGTEDTNASLEAQAPQEQKGAVPPTPSSQTNTSAPIEGDDTRSNLNNVLTSPSSS